MKTISKNKICSLVQLTRQEKTREKRQDQQFEHCLASLKNKPSLHTNKWRGFNLH
jgi:hypothetical protein